MKRITLGLLLFSLLNALSGYARELALATKFGAGMVTDAYFVAISIPMVLGDLLIGSVLVATVVPAYSRLHQSGQNGEIRALLNANMLLLVGFSVTLCIVIEFLLPALIDVLVPGMSLQGKFLAIHLASWLVWLLPLNGLLLFFAQVLNSRHSYLLPASTWLVVNIFFVAVLFLAPESGTNPQSLIVAAITGPATMLMILLVFAYRQGIVGWCRPDFGSGVYRDMLRMARPVLLTFGVGSGLGLLMISHVILRSHGSHLGEGMVSSLSYAFRIYEVPVSLVTATIGTVIYPAFARMHERRDIEAMRYLANALLTWGMVILVPIAAFVMVAPEFVVSLLFQFGHFSAGDTHRTAEALRGFGPAILFEALFMIYFRLIYATRRTVSVVLIGLLSVAVLVGFLWFGPNSPAYMGIALSSSFLLTAVMSVTLLALALGAVPKPNWSVLMRAGTVLVVMIALYVFLAGALGHLSIAVAVAFAALYVVGYGVSGFFVNRKALIDAWRRISAMKNGSS